MIENMLLIGICDEFIDELIDKIGYDRVLNLACNYEKVKKNRDLLKSFGIKDIDNLMIKRSHLFLEEPEILLKKFSQFNIPVVVELINDDVNVIDEIINYK